LTAENAGIAEKNQELGLETGPAEKVKSFQGHFIFFVFFAASSQQSPIFECYFLTLNPGYWTLYFNRRFSCESAFSQAAATHRGSTR
jgi:hypothetical protein